MQMNENIILVASSIFSCVLYVIVIHYSWKRRSTPGAAHFLVCLIGGVLWVLYTISRYLIPVKVLEPLFFLIATIGLGINHVA